MPNISFDIFFDQDFINISASRGKHAPKAKPEWKVRTAPKLPPKEKPADPTATPRPEARPPLNSSRPPAKLAVRGSQEKKEAEDKPAQKKDTEDKSAQKKDSEEKPAQAPDTGNQASDKPRRKPPKLGPRKSAATNGATDIPAPDGVKATS